MDKPGQGALWDFPLAPRIMPHASRCWWIDSSLVIFKLKARQRSWRTLRWTSGTILQLLRSFESPLQWWALGRPWWVPSCLVPHLLHSCRPRDPSSFTLRRVNVHFGILSFSPFSATNSMATCRCSTGVLDKTKTSSWYTRTKWNPFSTSSIILWKVESAFMSSNKVTRKS